MTELLHMIKDFQSEVTFIMETSVPYISEATYMCLLPTVILLICVATSRIRSLCRANTFPASESARSCSLFSSFKQLSPVYRIVAAALAILYILMTSVTEVLKGRCFSEIYLHPSGILLRTLLIITGAVSCFVLLCRVFRGFSFRKTDRFFHLGNTPLYTAMVPITVITLFFLIGSFPGYMSSDTAYSWYSVMLGSYSDWHTVTFLYVLKAVQKIFGNPYPIVLFQAALWLIVNQYALSLLERYAPYKYADILYLSGNLLLFGCYRALSNLEKDTMWNLALFLFCLCIFDLIMSASLKWYKIVLLLLSAWITATIRHMGDAIVLVTLAGVFLYYLFRRRKEEFPKRRLLAGTFFSSIILKFLLVNILGFTILYAVPNPAYVKYSIPMSMVGAVAVHEDIDSDDAAVMEQVMPISDWQEYYDKYYADNLSRDWGPVGENIYKLNDPELGKDILLLNLKFLFKYPVTYLTAYFDMTSIVWEMGTPADGYEWVPISMYSSAVDQYPELSGLQMHYNRVTTAIENISALSDRIPVYASITWRGGFSLFMLILSFFLLLKKKHLPETFILLPALLLAGVLFLANPSQDPRYINSWQMLMNFIIIYSIMIPGRDLPGR